MIKVAALAGVATLAGCSDLPHVLTQTERLAAEIGARRYADATDNRFVSCFSTDRNGDSLITCTIRKGRVGEGNDTFDISCGYRDGKIGCKQKEILPG